MISKERLLDLTQKVISYDSVNPPGNELALSKFIEKDMRSLGIDVKKVAYAKNRPNIIATIKGTYPRARARREALLITPHFDTVPIGDGWKQDPFGGKIVKGRLYGRGATDDKGNLASCMEVMRSLVEDRVQLKKDVIMAATVDEETGSNYGIIPLLKKKILRPGFALVMDSTEFDAVVTQKGLIHGKVTIRGKKAHGAYNWRGRSAIEDAAKVIVNLKKLKYPYTKHPLLKGPSMNIGVIKGGNTVNMVADFCEFTVDTRFLPGTNPKDVLKLIHAEIKKVTKTYKFEIDDIQQPYVIDMNHPLVELYLEICKAHKCKAAKKGSEGATVMTLFQDYNIPAFATGFGAHGTAHTNDEYINVKSLVNGTQVLEDFIKYYDQI